MRRSALTKAGENVATTLTAASYARFSTKHQKDTSIDDQEALNQRTADRFGYKIVHKYADRAKSGRSQFGREELDNLIEAIKRREFDALIIEDIDRITRDKEDLQHILKRMKFARMKLILPHGEISDMEADFKGIISAEFIKGLIAKIKRGLDARVEKGLFPGAVTYGYGRVELAPGIYNPGVRCVDEQQAGIVRRIFTEYANGVSPRTIAMGLTRDGIPSPSGAAQWSHQTIIGGSHGHGILSNRLYIGEIVWNTHATVKSPYTGNDVKQAREASEHLVCAVPHLRIIDQKLWDAAQAIRAQRSRAKAGPNGRRAKQDVVSRSPHLLSGLLRCSECNGSMRFKGKDREGHSRVICAAAYDHGSCSHSKSYGVEELKEAVFDHLREMLQDEEVLRVACEESAKHFEQLTKGNSTKRGDITRKLTNVNVKIERAARAIVEGTSSPTLEKMLTEMEIERAGLEQQLERVKDNNLSLHPNLVPKVLEATRDLHRLLSDREETPKLRAGFRGFVDHIDVIPTGKRMPVAIRTYGRMEAMLGADIFPPRRSNEEILETEGLSRSSNGNTLLAEGTPHRTNEKAVALR
jgi:site-specific DNA recombinase